MEFPDVNQPWCADDYGALGTLANIELYFNSLKLFSLGRGYYPKPLKIVLIVQPDDLEAVKGLDCVKGSKFALACVILAVLSGKIIPSVIG